VRWERPVAPAESGRAVDAGRRKLGRVTDRASHSPEMVRYIRKARLFEDNAAGGGFL
jgi:hypothetical protein